jgi:4-hydroxythreonine-4-phosphate dehydrogenase
LEAVDWVILGETDRFVAGCPDDSSSAWARDVLEDAARRLGAGELDGVVTGPVCKHRMRRVGFDFPGQTEFFAARAGVRDFAMCLTGGRLTVALVTAHLPLNAVAGALRQAEIVRVGRLLAAFLRRRLGRGVRIAVCGLNPHAGEEGDLGAEEETTIRPACAELANESGAEFAGPLSPDTVFFRAVSGEFDGVLCMYHDQGLIPLKLEAFHEGVNVTLGLPFVRTSPDHGTAFDIAGTGMARADSMRAAMRLAAELCGGGATEPRRR